MNEVTTGHSKKSPTEATLENGKSATSKAMRKVKARPDSTEDSSWDQSEARSRQILTAIMAFRDGDFAVRLPTDWAGTDGRIAEAFNQTIGHEDRIAQEVTRLSMTVGKEG